MSNRSLAAARNKRAPQEIVSDASLKKNQQMPPQKRPQNMPPPPPSFSNDMNASPSGASSHNGNKLSISDAIGLITIRLSKLESHTLKEKSETQSTTAGGVADVDTVIRSLVSRVSGLEKSTEDTQEHLEDLDAVVKERLDDLNNAVKELEENPERTVSVSSQPEPELLERLEKTEKEVSELKHLVIRLQTMLIESTMAAKMSPAQVYVPLTAPTPTQEPPEMGSMTVSI